MTKISIDRKTATLKAIYSDDLIQYIDRLKAEFGLPRESVRIRRATHVEPDPDQLDGGNWFVDLSPVGGPRVYKDEEGRPFILRESALGFETRWLEQNWLRNGSGKDSNYARSLPQKE